MVATATTATPTDKEAEAIEAIEEVIAAYGPRLTVAACLKSSAGDQFEGVGSTATLRVIQVVLRQIVYSANPQLEAEIMALGSGVILDSDANGTRVAEKHGLTKAAVSFRARKFIGKWRLPPSLFMKSERACAVYALTNKPRES